VSKIIEVHQTEVDKMINKIYRDALIKKSTNDFITLKYTLDNFPKNLHQSLHRVLGFLPNTNYKGKPFIMSVSHNKSTKEFEIIVKNPKI